MQKYDRDKRAENARGTGAFFLADAEERRQSPTVFGSALRWGREGVKLGVHLGHWGGVGGSGWRERSWGERNSMSCGDSRVVFSRRRGDCEEWIRQRKGWAKDGTQGGEERQRNWEQQNGMGEGSGEDGVGRVMRLSGAIRVGPMAGGEGWEWRGSFCRRRFDS